MDIASVLGTLLGLFALLGGQLLEGGSLIQLVQLTSALIVVGGTAGATLVAFPINDLKQAFKSLPLIFKEVRFDTKQLIQDAVRISGVARKEGLLSIESHRASIRDPLFRSSIKLVVDGFDPPAVREIIEAEMNHDFEETETAARVFEGAGGYAPTIGILGAVLGLIHVMMMLNEPSKIGEGIAVAFVATIYGVGLSNLILLPWGAKLKRKASQKTMFQEIVKAGVLGIQEGLSPHFLERKLEALLSTSSTKIQNGNQNEKKAS